MFHLNIVILIFNEKTNCILINQPFLIFLKQRCEKVELSIFNYTSKQQLHSKTFSNFFNLEFPFPKDALYQIRLNLIQWF